MEQHAQFMKETDDLAKESDVYKNQRNGKKIVMIFDNAPCHQ